MGWNRSISFPLSRCFRGDHRVRPEACVNTAFAAGTLIPPPCGEGGSRGGRSEREPGGVCGASTCEGMCLCESHPTRPRSAIASARPPSPQGGGISARVALPSCDCRIHLRHRHLRCRLGQASGRERQPGPMNTRPSLVLGYGSPLAQVMSGHQSHLSNGTCLNTYRSLGGDRSWRSSTICSKTS